MSDERETEELRTMIVRLRHEEARLTRDALGAIRIYAEPGRPAAIDAFIDTTLAAARTARVRAAEAERVFEGKG